MTRWPHPLPALWTRARRLSIATVLAMLFAQALVLAMAAWLTRALFIALGVSSPTPESAGWLALALGGCAATLYALRVLERQAAEYVAQDYGQQIRRALLVRLAAMPQSQLQRQLLRQVTARLSGDMSALQAWIAQGAPRLLAAAILLPAFTAVLLLIDPVLAVAALAPVALCLTLLALAGPRLGATYREVRRARARLAMNTLERLRMAPALRSMGVLQQEIRLLRQQAEDNGLQSRRKGRWSALIRQLPELGTGIGAACVLGVAVLLDRASADAAASLAALGLLATTLTQLAGVWDRWHAWRASRRLLAQVLGQPLPRAKDEADDNEDGAHEPDELRPGSRAADAAVGEWPSDLAARIRALPRGSRVSLSGPAATGKSHLLRQLAGLEGPAGPESPVHVSAAAAHPGTQAGRSAPPLPSVQLISALGPWLRGSLEKNLTFGVARRQERAQAAREACERVGLGRLRERLAARGERVQEQALNLSTRERFLVLLARAWVQPPDLLLIDLGDWALDAALHGQIRRLLEHAPQTTLVTASAEPVDWGAGTQQWTTTLRALPPPGNVTAGPAR